MFGSPKEEVTGRWGNFFIEEFSNYTPFQSLTG
jgi:hypothetical protein